MTDDQIKMQGLLDIAQHYGQQYRIEYGANKTVISVVGSKKDMDYYKDIQPWTMDNLPVSVKDDNDHLGLVVSGYREEEKNIDMKIRKARGALFKLLGPAFSSKCLLSSQVKIHLFRIFVCPIARSGLSSMTLRDNHLQPLSSFHKKSDQRVSSPIRQVPYTLPVLLDRGITYHCKITYGCIFTFL